MPDVLQTPPQEPKRSKLVGYGPAEGAAADARRWARNAFTQEKLVAALKTLACVAPLTVLIWIYAEREQLYPDPGVPIPINVSTGDPTRVVTLLRPQDKMILADLEGPRSKIESVRNEFSRTGGIQAVDIMLDRLQLAPGTHELRTASLVGSHPMFVENGITVTNCQPPTLHVAVDEYETREVAVQPPPDVTNLVGQPVFDPPRVRVRAPRSDFDRVGQVRVYADLSNVAELSRPGEHAVTALPATSPELQKNSSNVSIAPTKVNATLTVRQADEEYEMPFMVVFTSLPAQLQRRYSVECEETISNVKLIGPPDKIAPLKQENYQGPRPYAVLEVSRED